MNFVRNINKLAFGVLFLIFLGSSFAQAQGVRGVIEDSIEFTGDKVERILKLRSNAHKWEHIVRGFRKEHHFSMESGYAAGEWHFDRISDLVNQRYASSSLNFGLSYSFHIPIYKRFGYYLGTSMGYQLERQADIAVDPPTILKFPGFLAGLVMNFTPTIRMRLGSSMYLERWDDFQLKLLEDEQPFSATTRVLEGVVACDLFYDLYWGLSFQYQTRKNYYLRPQGATNYILDADLAKNERQFSVNLIYHLM